MLILHYVMQVDFLMIVFRQHETFVNVCLFCPIKKGFYILQLKVYGISTRYFISIRMLVVYLTNKDQHSSD